MTDSLNPHDNHPHYTVRETEAKPARELAHVHRVSQCLPQQLPLLRDGQGISDPCALKMEKEKGADLYFWWRRLAMEAQCRTQSGTPCQGGQ